MSASTVYDIRLRYLLEDRTSKGLNRIDRNLKKTGKNTNDLRRKFKQIAAGATAYFGFRAAGKHLIGFNADMQQAKIQMAGMLQLAGKMSSDAATKNATKLVGTLQQKAKASVGTTKDMVSMASLIVRPVMAAGMGMKQLADFTAQAVVASKAFGIESGMAARDIESALMGQLRSVDRFSRNILEPLGYIGEAGRKAFNELGAAARATELGKALGGPAISSMAQAQAKSFSGVLSTFQDSLQMFMGKVGKPLFSAITGELKNWNVWIEKNGQKMEDFGKRLGSGLVSGFRTVKSVIGFMVDHSEILLTVAKAWAAVKIGEKLGGLAGSIGNVLGQGTRRVGAGLMAAKFDKAGLATAKFGAKIASAAQGLGMLAGGIGLMITAIGAFESYMNRSRNADLKKKASEKAAAEAATKDIWTKGMGVTGLGSIGTLRAGTSRELAESIGNSQERRAANIAAAKRSGVRGADAESFGKMSTQDIAEAMAAKEGLADRQKFFKETATMAVAIGAINASGGIDASKLDEMAKRGRSWVGVRRGAGGQAGEVASLRIYKALIAIRSELQASSDPTKTLQTMMRNAYVEGTTAIAIKQLADAENADLSNTQGKKAKINVTINRIEVQSDDPDRFVFQLAATIRDVAKNPSQASGTNRLG